MPEQPVNRFSPLPGIKILICVWQFLLYPCDSSSHALFLFIFAVVSLLVTFRLSSQQCHGCAAIAAARGHMNFRVLQALDSQEV